MKKILSLLLVFIFLFSLSLPANASSMGYFKLTPSDTRLTNDGYFTFEMDTMEISDHYFIATSYYIPLTVSALVYSENPSIEPHQDDSALFTIYLYKVGISTPVGQFTHAANGTVGSTSFNVTTGAEYYFKLKVTGSLGAWEYIKGSGDLSNLYITRPME